MTNNLIGELIDKAKKYQSDEEINLIYKSIDFAKNVHKEQFRVSGEPFYFHPLEVAKILEEQGIAATVIDLHTIKPVDESMIEKVCNNTKLMVTVEEHNIIGGLGSAVAEYKSTLKEAPPQLFVGLPDSYGKANNYSHLMEENNLTAEAIAKKIINAFQSL